MIFTPIVGKLLLYFAAVVSGVLLFAMPYFAKDRRQTGAIRASYQWIIGIFGALTAAMLVLLAAFIVQDYSFQYVASYSSADMSVPFRMAALWAGHEGSLLLWAWLVAAFSAAIAAYRLKTLDRLDTYALVVMNGVQFFFLALLALAADPFTVSQGGAVGQGINPLLLHWAMIIHPPTLFIGYAGLTVPFAYAMAAAWTREPSAKWITHTHRWSVFSWMLLSIGIFLGALWAYVVLGWGGYWGWDPVENASLLPWLTATAMLHSFTVYKRRDSFKLWSLALTVVTFLLVIVATFITRGGILQSVHAFPPNLTLRYLFVGFIGFVAIASGQLISSRYALFKSGDQLQNLSSKEFMYFANNLILVAGAFILLGATMLPVFGGSSLKPESYNTIAQPIGLVYIGLLAVCPMFGWRKTDPKKFRNYAIYPSAVTILAAYPLFIYWQNLGKMVRSIDPTATVSILGYVGLLLAVFAFTGGLVLFGSGAAAKAKRSGKNWLFALGSLFVENRAQAGGYLSHLGVAVILAGLVGSSMFVGDINEVMPNKAGSSLQMPGYELKLKGISASDQGTRKVEVGTFDLIDRSSGKVQKVLAPQNVLHNAGPMAGQSTRNVDIDYQPFQDIFVIFGGSNPDNTISVNVKINPLIMFVWGGSGILVLGMAIAMWPKRRKAKAA
ncbi:MAG: heme lyase CcmF/NrfE family subunit [Actinobacteria bacterium]|nr:MAG: heme lyase CcmF/NrfE family subunit [Actinomycetota bacterium]